MAFEMDKVTCALIQSKVDSVKDSGDKWFRANNNGEKHCRNSIIEQERERQEQKKSKEKLYAKRSAEREKFRQKYKEKYGISGSPVKKTNETGPSVAKTSSNFAKQTQEIKEKENKCYIM